jgi:hypothetical protein
MIREIEISGFRIPLAPTSEENKLLKDATANTIRAELVDAELCKVNFFNLDRDYINPSANSEDKLTIICNAALKEDNTCENITLVEPQTIAYKDNNFTTFLSPAFNDDSVIIKSEHNIPLAEFLTKKNCMFILFDLFNEDNESKLDMLKYIMNQVNELVYKPRLTRYSWRHTQDKAGLTEELEKQLIITHEQIIEEDKRQLYDMEQRKLNLMGEIRIYTQRIEQKMKAIDNSSSFLKTMNDNFFKNLDLIVEHPKVNDLTIKNGIYTVNTVPLRIHADNGKLYQAGEYKIEIKPALTEVRFFSHLGRKSFWTDHDPHPHIDGSSGKACLGNLDTTVAELCAKMELYVLVLMLIDFLETANTDDAAGQYVRHWDEIDEEGNIINYGDDAEEEYECTCERCGEGCNETYTAYYEIEEDDDGYLYANGEHYVCEDCLNDEGCYVYDNDVNEYIAV